MADAIYGILKYPALSTMFRKFGRVEVDSLQWKHSAEHVLEVYKSALKTPNTKEIAL
jgi:hypothetical protein